MPKLPIDRAEVTPDGVAGDWQKNRKYHGGPNRAICLYSEELYQSLRDAGVEVGNGDIGEQGQIIWPPSVFLPLWQIRAF